MFIKWYNFLPKPNDLGWSVLENHDFLFLNAQNLVERGGGKQQCNPQDHTQARSKGGLAPASADIQQRCREPHRCLKGSPSLQLSKNSKSDYGSPAEVCAELPALRLKLAFAEVNSKSPSPWQWHDPRDCSAAFFSPPKRLNNGSQAPRKFGNH